MGKRTSEIKAILSKEHKSDEVAAALHDMKNLQTRIESQEQEMAFLRQELQELRTVSRPEKNKWYKRIFGK